MQGKSLIQTLGSQRSAGASKAKIMQQSVLAIDEREEAKARREHLRHQQEDPTVDHHQRHGKDQKRPSSSHLARTNIMTLIFHTYFLSFSPFIFTILLARSIICEKGSVIR